MIEIIIICVLVCITCIFSIATSSIGIQAYNDNPSYKDSKPTNFKFLVGNLIASIVIFLICVVIIVIVVKTGGGGGMSSGKFSGQFGKISNMINNMKQNANNLGNWGHNQNYIHQIPRFQQNQPHNFNYSPPDYNSLPDYNSSPPEYNSLDSSPPNYT